MDKDEKEIKGKLALNKILATLSLIGAMFCLHFTYTQSGWQSTAFACGLGLLCSITITRTLKASVYASALVAGELITAVRKATR